MSRLKLIFAIIAIGGVGLLFVLQYERLAKLRTENDSLRQEIVQLQANAAPPDSSANTNDSLTSAQLSELLKLRAEVTQLREQTNGIASLRQQNEKLQASLKDAATNQPKPSAEKSPADVLPQDIHPKASWGYRGYSTPDATIESLCWAMMKGDKATFMAGLSPEMRAKIEDQTEGKDFAEDVKKVNNTEFRILDRRQLSDDEMVLTISTTSETPEGDTTGHSEKTVFKRINGEWMVTDKQAPGE